MPATQVGMEARTVETRQGTVPVRVYRPSGTPRGGLVWAHGGGFLGGDLDMPEAHWVAHSLAERGITVVSVDYSLAPVPVGYSFRPIAPRPGVHYPVASEQLTDVFVWTVRQDLGVPRGGWSLGGASAGAALAAGAVLRLRDEGADRPAGVLLVYAPLHAVTPDSTAAARTFLQDNYLGAAPPDAPYAFAGGKDLDGYPPTFVLNADVDDLRPSGEAFAAELAAASADVLLAREDGTSHGYLNEPDNPGASRSIERISAWITRRA